MFSGTGGRGSTRPTATSEVAVSCNSNPATRADREQFRNVRPVIGNVRKSSGQTHRFAHEPPDLALEILTVEPDMFPERVVDERLIVAAAGLAHSGAEPPEHVIVDADGDARLSLVWRNDRSASTTAKIVFLLHFEAS
jgi:hypothetical protein